MQNDIYSIGWSRFGVSEFPNYNVSPPHDAYLYLKSIEIFRFYQFKLKQSKPIEKPFIECRMFTIFYICYSLSISLWPGTRTSHSWDCRIFKSLNKLNAKRKRCWMLIPRWRWVCWCDGWIQDWVEWFAKETKR